MFICVTITAEARKGVGISWSTETEAVEENKVHCIDYGLYNPWDEDVYAVLSTSGELSDIVTIIEREPQPIKAKTASTNAIQTRICFEVKDVYKESCILGMLCERKCNTQPPREFIGQIIVKEKNPQGVQGSGSSVTLDVAAPLKIKVKCEDKTRSYVIPLIIVITLIIIILITWIVQRRRTKPYQAPTYPSYQQNA